MRVCDIGDNDHCPFSTLKNGNQYIRYPIRKISSVRLNILPNTAPLSICANFFMVKLMALPTAKRKEGNTRSVGVNPFHLAWLSGQKASPPGLLTMIIKQIVIPRNTSRDKNRGWVSAIIQ